MTSLGERLKSIRESLSLNQTEFGALFGISRTTQAHYERGERSPDTDYLLALKKLGTNIDYLLTGDSSEIIEAKNQISIDYYNVEASAGTGLYPIDEKYQESFSVSPDVFMRDLKYVPKNMSMIRVKGDSMIGTLNDGDRILIDHDRTEIQEGIFVIRIDGELLVKRIQRMPGRIINVISSNPDYLPISISLDSPPLDFAVIGRVIMVCKFI